MNRLHTSPCQVLFREKSFDAFQDTEYLERCEAPKPEPHAKTVASYDDSLMKLSQAQGLTDVGQRKLQTCTSSFSPQDSHEDMREVDGFKSLSIEHVIVVNVGALPLFQALLAVFETEVPVDLKHLSTDRLTIGVEAFEGYTPVCLSVHVTSQSADVSNAVLTHTSGEVLRFWRLMHHIADGLRSVGITILQPSAACPLAASTCFLTTISSMTMISS
jgi:hypothetical protein